MGDADKCAGLHGPGRDLRSALLRSRGREIGGQAGGDNVPDGTVFERSGVQFRAQNRRKFCRTKRPRIGDGKAVLFQEMVGQGDKIVAGLRIQTADLLRRLPPVWFNYECSVLLSSRNSAMTSAKLSSR